MRYKKELLGKTYCFILDQDPKTIVCMFTLSNDSIRVDVIPNNRGRKLSQGIPREKRMRRYPGVLIGRLGINAEFRNPGIGTELLDFITHELSKQTLILLMSTLIQIKIKI